MVARRAGASGCIGNGGRGAIGGFGGSGGGAGTAAGAGCGAAWYRDGERGAASGAVRRAASHHHGGRVREDGAGGVPGYCEGGGADELASHVGDAGQAVHRGGEGAGGVPDRLRQRWVAGHLFREWVDAGCDEREGGGSARGAVPQQPRRDVYGCDGEGGRGQRALGVWVRGGGLRQRWLAGSVRDELREESAVPE